MTDPHAPAPPHPAPPHPAPGVGPDRAATIPTLWVRAGARIFDELLLAIPRLALTIPFVAPDSVTGVRYDPPKWAMALSVLIPLVYDFAFIAWRGATPGKSLFGTVVRRAAAGGKVAPYQAGLRALIPVFGSALALGVPSADAAAFFAMLTPVVYFSAVWDPRRRGLHDKAAGTVVVRSS